MELEELKSLIKTAFKDVEYPGDDDIAGCSRFGCDDCDPLAAHFKGTKWQEHNLQTLGGFDSLNFFRTEARHYYLPAYMLAELEDCQLSEEEPYPLPNLDISWSFLPSEHQSI